VGYSNSSLKSRGILKGTPTWTGVETMPSLKYTASPSVEETQRQETKI